MEERNTNKEYLSMDATVTDWVSERTPEYESHWENFNNILHTAHLIIELLMVITSLVGLAGNAVVLFLLGFRMQRNALSVYILNLAGADFLYLFTTILHLTKSFLNLHSNYILQVFSDTFVFPYIASLSILTAISTERCMLVLQPIWYHCHRPKHMSSIMCTMIWALSLVMSILHLEFHVFLTEESTIYLQKSIDFSIATWLMFSLVLMFGSSLVLLTRLLCGSQKRKLTRLCVIIGLSVLVFLFCGLPSGIFWFLLPWVSIKNNVHSSIVFQMLELFSCVNSCANPIIYFFVGSYKLQRRQQRRSLKLILQRALQEVPEEVER